MIGSIITLAIVITLALCVGTGIRLHTLKIRNVVRYSLLIPITLIMFILGILFGRIIKLEGNVLRRGYIRFRLIIVIISDLPMWITIGCVALKEEEDRLLNEERVFGAQEERIKVRYRDYEEKYKVDVTENLRGQLHCI